MTDHQPAIEEGPTPARVAAAALSVALTALVLRFLNRVLGVRQPFWRG